MEGMAPKYELGRLVLDYIRTFMWPAVLLLIAVFYWDDLMSVVRERQVNVFGVEIGPAVERLQEVEATAQQELQDVAALVEALKESYQQDLQAAIEKIRAEGNGTSEAIPEPARATALAEDIDAKLANLENNLSREVQQIQRTVTQAPQSSAPSPPAEAAPGEVASSPAPDRAEQVAALERRGFAAILAHDLEAALAAFTEARKVWPEYHNVAEIQRFLARLEKRGASPDDATWVTIERTILTDYSWGMPPDIRGEFRARVAALGS